jgi:hypothetical protein
MGSHGGATAEGQLEVLESYGITEEYLGCPIKSSMETVQIGLTEDGRPVQIDKNASEADGIVVSCRVKPHTCFRGPHESGILKMLAIGLAKQHGAMVCHDLGFGQMHLSVPLFGRAIMKHANILFAVATIENAFDETYRLEAVLPEDVDAVEPELLKDAFAHMPSIPFESCDVLVVDRVGKNISGDGMDPNIIGRCLSLGVEGGLRSQRIAVLDLTDETNGAALGVGMADVITTRLFNKIDFVSTYMNTVTCTELGFAKIPLMMENDRGAIQMALKVCTRDYGERPRVVRIANSLHIERVMISEALRDEAAAHPDIDIEGEALSFAFDADGNLW